MNARLTFKKSDWMAACRALGIPDKKAELMWEAREKKNESN